MEYFTADIYTNYKRIGEPFEDNGKMYVNVFENCPRCSGTGIVSFWGLCYCCSGTKGRAKTVRAYTAEEKAKMDKAKEVTKQKKEQNMRAEAEQKANDWLLSHGFNEEGCTYVILGETFSIKDKLKADGWKFDKVLKWHRGDAGEYADRCFKLFQGDIMSFDIFGHQFYNEGVEDLVKAQDDKYLLENNDSISEFMGEEKDKLYDIGATITGVSGFGGRYGWTNVYTFETAEGNVLVWFTSKALSYSKGAEVKMSGTVKEHKVFRGVKQTVLTRCKVEEI